jgi:hypothetical protein
MVMRNAMQAFSLPAQVPVSVVVTLMVRSARG